MASERVLKRLSQVELAEKLGVSPSSIKKWETGKTRPNSEMVKRMALFFGCTADYLLGMTEERVA